MASHAPAPNPDSSDALEACLAPLRDAGSGRSLLDLGWIRRVRRREARAVLELALPRFAASQQQRIAAEVREALLALPGIEDVQIELAAPPPPPSSGPIGGAGHGTAGHGAGGHGQVPERQPIAGVQRVIAVSSGKGGVGKSTVAVNLACALAQRGLKVGLLDADIYGPNAPTMLGVADRTPEVRGSGNDQVLTPIESCGIALVSMGLLIQENQPVIWRGPMLNGIIRQFLYQVDWGERDVLVVDLPPGTGDAQLSLAQAVPMAGAVIVTTPQKVSLQDARRGLAMFLQMGVPVLGVIENMSAFIPPDAPEKRYELFGRGGGAVLAAEAGVPLLAQLPLEMPVRAGGDGGRPVVLDAPDSLSALAFLALADRLIRPPSLPGAAPAGAERRR
ncbi:MAG: Mrp/NBP35 family ATP-binding protein [Cyanobium sp.]